MESEVELVNVRLVATQRRPRPDLRTEAASRRERYRRVYLDGGWLEVPVHGAAVAVAGPAIVELPEATCLVRPGWAGEPDATGTLVLEREWTP
jgi:N-methylhydantoinase A